MINQKITLEKDTYIVLKALGKGGQASVWKVRRERDDEILAMKSVLTFSKDKGIKPKQSEVDNLSQRLQHEIDFIKSLPNTEKRFIVPCLDSGYVDHPDYGKLPTWVMPYYKQMLEDKMPPYPEDKPIPVLFSQCLKWIEQVAIALEATHSFRTGSTKFVHRDVKATNMMLTESGDIRLIDFGIVRETTIDEETITHSYSIKSAAPEQVLPNSINAGRDSYAVGTHSDMYALGVVFYRFFSNGKESAAQLKLKEKTTLTQHAQLLDDDNTGLVGKIGGLTDQEYNELVNNIQFRFDDEYLDPDSTEHSLLSGELRNSFYITQSVADFIRALLNPVFSERPSASQMILWCQSIKGALSPSLQEIKLSTVTTTNKTKMPTVINLSMIGEGLPATANWVELVVNNKLIATQFDPLASDKQYFGFVTAAQTHWQMTLPKKIVADKSASSLSIRVKALVNGQDRQDFLTIKIKASAETLWNNGKHQQALCIELRKTWLDTLLQRCNSFSEASSLHVLLENLKSCQAEQLFLIEDYQQRLARKFDPNHRSATKSETEKKVEPPPRLTAEQLWEKGEHQQALCADLRDHWLDELQQQCKTKAQIKSHAALLKSLKKCHPNAESKLRMRLQLLREIIPSNNTTSKGNTSNANSNSGSGFKKFALTSLVLALLGGAGYWFINSKKPQTTTTTTTAQGDNTSQGQDQGASPEESEISQLATALSGNQANARLEAWKRLNQLSKVEHSSKAEAVLKNFIQHTFDLANAKNKNKQRQAFKRLKLLSQSGNKLAIKKLLQAYMQGKGIRQNWGKAWQWAKRGKLKTEKIQIERNANKILQSTNKAQALRNLAYQVAKKSAQYEPAGDPAQKWMVYRYTLGDGVSINLDKAQYWQDVYDGKIKIRSNK